MHELTEIKSNIYFFNRHRGSDEKIEEQYYSGIKKAIEEIEQDNDSKSSDDEKYQSREYIKSIAFILFCLKKNSK